MLRWRGKKRGKNGEESYITLGKKDKPLIGIGTKKGKKIARLPRFKKGGKDHNTKEKYAQKIGKC